MLGRRFCTLTVSAALLVGAGPAASAARAAAITPEEAAAIGRQAFLYGFPLLEFERVRRTATSVRCPDALGDAPVNAFSTTTRFATPAARVVVAPNVDTLYSVAEIDLARGPVVLSHPDMGRRYFSFQLLDPYTNTIGYVGSRTTGRKAGRFAITWSGHRGRRVRGARVVRSRYRRLWVIGRTLATTRADRRRALKLMRRYVLAPPGGPRRFPRGCDPGPVRHARTPTGGAFLPALARATRRNPPPARDAPLLARLARAGIAPGRSPDAATLGQPAYDALVAAIDATAAALPGLATSTLASQAAANQGWTTPSADLGAYGTDYTTRAAVAAVGLGANTREEAVYPTALTDATGAALDGTRAYRLTFAPGRTPPNRAFWSLTLYDLAGYLVANPVKRYAVGPSHPPLVRRADGSVVIALQRTEPAEPDVNWLPTPAAPFRLSLRVYVPRRSVLDGRWKPPGIVPVGQAAGR